MALNSLKAKTLRKLRWKRCSGEWGKCKFKGRAIVRYGKKGKYAYKEARNGISCTNSVFGDPNYGVVKECHYLHLSNRFRFCAKENGICKTHGKFIIKYGRKGKFNYKLVHGTTPCTNKEFGDPIVGTKKKCYIVQLGGHMHRRKKWRRWIVGGKLHRKKHTKKKTFSRKT